MCCRKVWCMRFSLSPTKIRRAVEMEARAFSHALRSRMLRPRVKLESARQKPTILAMSLPGVTKYPELVEFLTGNGFTFHEGRHTLYLPPQDGLQDLLGRNRSIYPPDAGLKLLKSLGPVDRATYLVDGYRRPVTKVVLGGVANQADAASLLFVLGLGPRPYDLAEVQAPGFRTACFVVQHIDGCEPSDDERVQFISQMRQAVARFEGAVALVPAEGWDHVDFGPPDCRGNLLKSHLDGRLYYIDSQQFLIMDKRAVLTAILNESRHTLHFGRTRRILGSVEYLYQSVPGVSIASKRDVQERWGLYLQLLTMAGVDLTGRAVLDICCNAGMFMALGLAHGAKLAIGWDLPEVVTAAERLQCLLGNTRINFRAAHLNPGYVLSRDVPSWMGGCGRDSIVFYLAAKKHVGLIRDLANIPWRALVYEGHQGESEEDCKRDISEMEHLWNCVLTAQAVVSDGDSGMRRVALLTRP